tara:strand:- start:76 stop:531 length:456 start_codon:yes stop_codon:yes gene_type:complete
MHYLNKFLLLFLIPIILIGCKLQEPNKNHGILFLENRYKKLIVNKTNTNDVLKIVGIPHTNYINDKNTWLYFERVLAKGEYIKLGQNVLRKNNVLILQFDKYGILVEKKILKKEDKKDIKFSKKNTENQLSQKSFVETFLSSIKEKMYSGK